MNYLLSSTYIWGGAGLVLLLLILLVASLHQRKHRVRPIKLPTRPNADALRQQLLIDVDSSQITRGEETKDLEAYYLAIDTETYEAISFLDELRQVYKISRPVAISWQVLDKSGKLIRERSFILKQEPEENEGQMKPDAIAIHGITPDMLLTGTEPEAVFQALEQELSVCKMIVAHNLYFHRLILCSELRRLGRADLAERLEHFPQQLCTMEWGKTLGFKQAGGTPLYPSLEELFGFLYFKRMHLPFAYKSKTLKDVRLLAACLRIAIQGK